ncbi:hypothetical protein [Acinetobacter sp. ANC 4177]|uniref:hypothetical protein n=1 Tax=Acinetobacter sp. ANC 4177 TaxID=2529838 RepID=UPI00103B79AF|nr:hypothetical protein [Acinetobacter sp. ANC 4177]TCB72990.1 hypothetical protein E0H91_14555 [Acinetobacter sp. ANC 4177]
MYINEVISYLGAWDRFKNDHPNLLNDLYQVFSNTSEIMLKDYKETNKFDSVYSSSRNHMINELNIFGWHHENYSSPTDPMMSNSGLGLKKDSCYIKIASGGSSSILMSWIFSDIQVQNKLGNISIPLLVVLDYSDQEFFKKLNVNNYLEDTDRIVETRKYLKFVKRRLERISPLNFEYPFLILGIGLENKETNILEIETDNLNKNSSNLKLDRCIEFSPEYYQAGLSILTYFGSVLREKYPEQNATVKIEQHDLTVRMIIETEDGNIETLEKALHEYELVLKGQQSADEFYLSPIKTLELKNQLNLFKFQIDSQKEIIALQHGRILSLEAIVDKALSPVIHPPITIINQLHNSQSTAINHKVEFTKSNDELEDLIDLADSEALKNRLATIQNGLEVNRNSDQPKDVKDSSGMKKLAKFLKDANEVGTEANTLAEKGGKALDLIKSLGRRYNSIAEWCGMPNIPTVFVKE